MPGYGDRETITAGLGLIDLITPMSRTDRDLGASKVSRNGREHALANVKHDQNALACARACERQISVNLAGGLHQAEMRFARVASGFLLARTLDQRPNHSTGLQECQGS